jgi:uncharacterized membrane protein
VTGTRQPNDPPTPGGPAPPPERPRPSSRRRTLTPQEAQLMEAKVRQVEVAISLVLRIGVVLSVAVIAAGLGLMFAHHAAYLPITGRFSYRQLTSPAAQFPHSFGALGRAIGGGEGRGVVVLGVLILILTPVLRVAVGVLAFIYEKDPPMTLVTLFVLIVLIGSFFLAGV